MDQQYQEPVPGPSCDDMAVTLYRPQNQPDDADSNDNFKKYQSTVGQYGVELVPEDIDEDCDINPCTFEVGEADETPTFDYYEYYEFNRLQVLLFQVQKHLNAQELIAKKGEERKAEQTPSTEVPTLKFVRSMFRKMYGDVDFESPQMKAVLESIKETLMEQASMGLDELKIMLLDEDIAVNLLVAEEQLTDLILRKFDDEKRFMYTTFNPRQAKGEWFVLPRKHPGIIRERNFEELPPRKKSVAKFHNEREEDKPSGSGLLSNLHLYDPKFEFCFTFPNRIFTRDYEEWEVYKDINRILSNQILTHLNKFPFGIAVMAFWESYFENYKNRPSVEYLTLTEILHQFPEEIWFAKDSDEHPDHPLPELLFPGFLKNVVDPDTILKRIWHGVNCILGMKSFILSDHLWTLLQLMYSIKFHPKDWGFENSLSFVAFCNKRFGSVCVGVHRVLCTTDEKVNQFDYFLIQSNYWRRHVEGLHGVQDVNASILKPVPKDFLGQSDVIDSISNHCSLRENLVCSWKCMTDPFNIYLVMRSFRQRLNAFMDALQVDPEITNVVSRNPPAADMVAIGMYVLAFVKGLDIDRCKEWHRVKVLHRGKGKSGSGLVYFVYSIDYGFHSHVSHDNIRLLPRGKFSEELAFAIPVRLKLEHPNRKEKFGRKKLATRILSNIIDKSALLVQLNNGRFNDTLGCMKWKVTCYLVKPYPVIEFQDPEDLAVLFAREYDKFLTKQAEQKLKAIGAEAETKTAASKQDADTDEVQAETAVSASEQDVDDDDEVHKVAEQPGAGLLIVPEEDEGDTSDSDNSLSHLYTQAECRVVVDVGEEESSHEYS